MDGRGFLIVISGPSAVGKTSVAAEVLKREKKLSRIVTCTTRSPRNGEVNGQDYFFMDTQTFSEHKNKGDFAEYSEVYGNYYGVLIPTIKEKIDNNENALLVINWEGFAKIKKIFTENVIGFFLTAPSQQELEKRIRSRGTDNEEIIQNRMKMASEDMKHKDIFDHIIENEEINKCADTILNIVSQYLHS